MAFYRELRKQFSAADLESELAYVETDIEMAQELLDAAKAELADFGERNHSLEDILQQRRDQLLEALDNKAYLLELRRSMVRR